MPPIIRLTILFAAGIGLGALAERDPGLLMLAGVAALIVIALRSDAPLLLVGVVVAGALAVQVALQRQDTRCAAALRDGQRFRAVADVLTTKPDGGAGLRLRTIGSSARVCNDEVPARIPVRAQTRAGTRVELTGTWWAASGPRADGRGSIMVEQVKLVGPAGIVDRTRAGVHDRIGLLFGPYAPLTDALLIARMDGIPREVKQDFAASGLSHLLAISGTHVALVAAVLLLFGALLRLPQRSAAVVGTGGAVAYVLFLGAPFAALRAAVQVVLLLASRLLQRPAYPFALMAAAALLILVIDPLALFDPGCQLSFSGIAGILLWRRKLIDLQPESVPLMLRDALATGTSATLATTPIAAWHFGQVSTIAIFANLLAVPLVSIIVPGAAAALVISVISVPVARFIAGGMSLLLARLQQIAALAAAVPYGHFAIARETLVLVCAAVVLAMVWMRQAKLRKPVALALAFALVCTAVLLEPAISRIVHGRAVDIYMIDVGQGDAIALRSPGGRWVLIDAGPRSPTFDAGAQRVVPFLQRQGARQVEALLVTHPHLDHFGGADAVVERLGARAILDPGGTQDADAELARDAAAGNASWSAARVGGKLDLDGMRIELLFPDPDALLSDDPNEYSVVARLEYGGFTALFTGDAPASVELDLIHRFGARLDIDLLKVGHHGSITSTGDSLVLRATPELALVSVGRRNRYGHPSPQVIERLTRAGARILRTDVDGTVLVRAFADGSYTIRTGL